MNDIKFKIVDKIDDEDLISIFDDNTYVYVRPGVYAMSDRKLESLKNIEIICINDGSPDNTASILKDYANRDGRIINAIP